MTEANSVHGFLAAALVSAIVGLVGYAARAQMPVSVIAGVPVQCGGIPAVLVPNVGDVAKSVPGTIVLDAYMFPRMHPLIQLFTYAHECGHHMNGDVTGAMLGHVNFQREQNADAVGIKALRDQLGLTRQQAVAIAAQFANNPPMWPFYLPGPQRAQWIIACYDGAPICPG
jgi:hypothetical protein